MKRVFKRLIKLVTDRHIWVRQIAIAGLAIESSTFSPAFTNEEDFKARIGDDVFSFYPFLSVNVISIAPVFSNKVLSSSSLL